MDLAASDQQGVGLIPAARTARLGLGWGSVEDSRVNEIDAGIEYTPWTELELSLMYSYSIERTNTRVALYDDTENAHRIGVQAQWNY